MKTRDLISFSIGIVGGITAFIVFQFVPANFGGIFTKFTFAFMAGCIVYIVALFVTYMVTDPKYWENG